MRTLRVETLAAGNVNEIDLQLAQPGASGGVLVVLCSNLSTAGFVISPD